MSTVAEQLRSAREAQKLTVQQIADATKIRTDHIHALEKGDFSVFSAPIYIRGSVKNYATRLKLDVPKVMATLDDELAGTENRIAIERRNYNQVVQDYNTYIALFPNSLVASMAGFQRNDAYFKTEPGARQAPKVDFNYDKKPAPATPAPTPAPVHP